MVVGRLTKEMKKAELMEQLTEANETYLEKISQHMECQYREMQRVERRIERKKKLIDKKYIVSIVYLDFLGDGQAVCPSFFVYWGCAKETKIFL